MSDLLDSPLHTSGKGFRFKLWVPLVWLGVFLVGYGFWFLHWPGNSVLRIIGFAGFAGYNASALFHLKGSHIVNNILITLSAAWMVVVVWGEFFNGGYPLNLNGIIVQVICLIVLAGMYIFIHYRRYGKK